MAAAARESYRFRDVVLDVTAYELRRQGRLVKLERQPMDLLILLARRRGALVTRQEIVDALWGPDVFVEVETGIHTAIRKIRHALRDSAEQPTFIETVPGKGYRFVAPVPDDPPALPPDAPGAVSPAPSDPGGTEMPVPPPSAAREAPAAQRRRLAWPSAALLAAFALAVAAAVAWSVWPRRAGPDVLVTIAVLPFESLGADPETSYLADGLAEDTIVSLGRVDPGRIAVIGRTTMAAYRGTNRPLAQIGRELGADYIVESSIRAEGERVRIAARLIRAADQVQVWTDSFDRRSTNVLDLQQELSADIASRILTRITPEQAVGLVRRHSRNPEAYHHFLRGRASFNQRSPEAMRQAADEYARAVALDPDYALAWAGLAMTASGQAINSDADPAEAAPRARAAATRAVALDPESPEAQYALGHVLFFLDWDWPSAEATFRRAIDRDPNFALGYQTLGHLLSQMGRHAEAASMMQRARSLEPRDAVPYALAAQVAFQGRQPVEALSLAAEAIRLNPDLWFGHMMAAQGEVQLEGWSAALSALDVAVSRSHNSKPLSLRGYVFGRTGRDAEAREVLAALEAAAGERYVPPYAMALVEAGRGHADGAFAWLERAYAARDVHLIYLPVDPKWDPFRTDPRFDALLARCDFMRQRRLR